MSGTPDTASTDWGKEALAGSTWTGEPKFKLRALVFEDQFGNTAYLEPDREPPVGTATAERRATFYGVILQDEYAAALEAVLFETERFSVMGRFADLRRRAFEFLGRTFGTPQ